jgi:rod shape determining protein RodA
MSFYVAPEEEKPKSVLKFFNLDATLLILITGLCSFGLFVLYSASRQNIDVVFEQAVRMGIGFFTMIFLAHIPLHFLKKMTCWIYSKILHPKECLRLPMH